MIARYVIEMLEPEHTGLARITRNGDRALWATAKMRKVCKCAFCKAAIQKGDVAYRPLGNQMYRYERLCQACVGRAMPNGRECPVCDTVQEDLAWEECCDGPTDFVHIEPCPDEGTCQDDEHHWGFGKHVHSLLLRGNSLLTRDSETPTS